MQAFHSVWQDWEGAETPIQRTDNTDNMQTVSFVSTADRHIQEGPDSSSTAGWDTETARIVEWFLATPPPAKPFDLFPHVRVIHPARWWRHLKADIATGPQGPRARYGALQKDLRRLAELFGGPRGPQS